MKTRVLNNIESNEFTPPDKYAFFVKHCYATLDVAWKPYLSQNTQDLLENMDDEFANIENPKKQFDNKIINLSNLCTNKSENESDLMKKCLILSEIYNLFVTPEVENDEILFEEMMEKLKKPILIQQFGSKKSV